MDAQEARQLGYHSAGQTAELLGLTHRTLRYYEDEGFVHPKRTDKGTRYYSDFDVERLEVCVRLACAGVPIKTIRELATIRPNADSGEESSHALVDVFEQIRADIRLSLSHMRRILTDMDKAERLIRTCWNCPNRPNRTDCPDCPCELELDSADLLRLTWDDNRPEPVPPDQ